MTTAKTAEHLQDPLKPRVLKLPKDMINNPLIAKQLNTQIDSVNLQYDALSQEAKSAVYRLSAVFIPKSVTPTQKLQMAEELIEMVARSRIPRAHM